MATVEGTASNRNSVSSRAPPLTQTDAITSLLSLSIAAANVASNPATTTAANNASALDTDPFSAAGGIQSSHGTATTPIVPTSAPMTAPTTSSSTGKHHRRLGSTGQTRRRLSDAREASTRPILAPATSSAALSLASLSLSTSPPSLHSHSHSLSQSVHTLGHGRTHSLGHAPSYAQAYPYPSNDDVKPASLTGTSVKDEEKTSTPIAISTSANGKAKKRGIDYKCESCAKIYRHPNCLNKHRWEHTRQWREASKFVLSKHQQVQLLEAATILSFMGTTSTSLPDDRSEWPSFVSGGSLPKVETVGSDKSSISEQPSAPMATPSFGQSHYAHQQAQTTARTTTYPLHPHLVSSSVPNVPSGPRMHDYSLPAAAIPGKVTQVRPGLLGVPTGLPIGTNIRTEDRGSPDALPTGDGGWSLPSSSLRSNSYTSRSRSGSRSRSRSGSGSRSEESLDVAVDVEGMDEEPEPDVRVASANNALRGAYPGYPAYAAGGLSHSPGYGYGAHGHAVGYGYGHSYGGRRGAGMKREEDEMSVGFSVREEDEEDEDEDVVQERGKHERKWDGMEMEVDMDMD